MKLLLISSLYGISGGGAGLIAWRTAQGLSKLGNEVVVATLGGTRHPVETEEDGLRVVRFQPMNLYPISEKDAHPAWKKIIWQCIDMYNPHSALVLRRIVEQESPDIIHVHKMRGFSGAVWQISARIHPGRVIQTCHDYESMSPDGYMRGSIGRMALRKQWPIRGYQLIRSKLSTGVSVLTAPSMFTLKRITDCSLFPLARPEVIWNTHGWSQDELKSIHKRAIDGSGDRVCFLFLGRLEKEKGIVELCEAFLLAFHSHPSMQLRIAGWGTLESQLREKYGRHPGIRFLGIVDGKEKEDTLCNATAVIIPSLWEEVFGVVTVEAFAFGKPVIASNVGGLPELVVPGETGWLVEPGDVRGLTERMGSVANMNPGQRAEMSQACMGYSREFALDKISSRYLELYREMIK